MASYQAEFLANYYETHRRPLSAVFFGHIHELARIASITPRLANALANGPVASAAKRILGLHRDRSLPSFAQMPFRKWFAQRESANSTGVEVLLFPDTFTNFFEPKVAIAGVEVLERAGFRVVIPPRDLCCGRPLYDQGMLDTARRRLLDAANALAPFVERGVKVVGLEPSCLLSFRDELPAMFPHRPGLSALSRNALLLDEFLAREAPAFMPPALKGRALVHGHCHQKSLVGLGSELRLLQKAEGLIVDTPDSGCCGMAGAFGYHGNHFEVSRQIRERLPIPSIPNCTPHPLIIADSFPPPAQLLR